MKKLSMFFAVILGLAAFGLAGAQSEITTMATTAQGGADAVKTAVVALVGVVLTIGLIIWGARHLKPKG